MAQGKAKGKAGRPKLYKFLRNTTQNRFLNYFLETGNISHAVKKMGIARQTHYDWLKDEAYEAAYQKARSMAADLLEEEAWRRAVKGHKEPVYFKGQKCGEMTVYSDSLLSQLLKAYKPDVYKDRVEQTVDMKADVNIMTERLKEAREAMNRDG